MNWKVLFLILQTIIYKLAFAQFPTKLDTISATTNKPYSNICYLEIYRERFVKSDGSNLSTGFFIAPNVILTAAHNIYSIKTSRVTEIKIIPAKYYNQFPYDSIIISGKENCNNAIFTHPNYSFTQKANKRIKYDFGFIVIPTSTIQANPKIPTERYFVLDSTYNLNNGDTLNVAGYPADGGYDGEFLTYQRDTCGNIFPKTFSHNLETFRGNSGSPIWIEKDNKYIIVGIHTFGESATKLDKEYIRLIKKWINQIPN